MVFDYILCRVHLILRRVTRSHIQCFRGWEFRKTHLRTAADSSQRSEGSSDLLTKKFRLFPGREVTALRESVVVDQFGIGFLCPGLRSCIDLIGKNAHGSRDRDTFRSEQAKLAFPIETSRRDRRIRQPIERDIVEDVVSRQAFGLTVETRAMSA